MDENYFLQSFGYLRQRSLRHPPTHIGDLFSTSHFPAMSAEGLEPERESESERDPLFPSAGTDGDWIGFLPSPVPNK